MFLVFLTASYALLRLGFGRAVAAASLLFLALPARLFAQHIGYPEFAELMAFASVALAVFAACVSDRLKDRLWYGVVGVALGLGFWGHQLTVTVVVAVVAALVLLRGPGHARAVPGS